jgi:hypothetical protein
MILGDPNGAHWSAERNLDRAVPDDPPQVEGPDIKFMWDHGVRVPLWADGALLPDDPDWLRAALGLSDRLIADLTRWGDGMSDLDGAGSSDRVERAHLELDVEARELVERLRSELDARYVVRYERW